MMNPKATPTQVSLHIEPGNIAPRYSFDVDELACTQVVITERGMESGLPLVDFQLEGAYGGKKYFLTLSGRVINAIAAAVQGVNMRNHGKAEP